MFKNEYAQFILEYQKLTRYFGGSKEAVLSYDAFSALVDGDQDSSPSNTSSSSSATSTTGHRTRSHHTHSDSAPLPSRRLADLSRLSLTHASSAPISTPLRSPDLHLEQLRARYKITVSLHKLVKNKIKPLLDLINDKDLTSETSEEGVQLYYFLKDLNSTLRSLSQKDSIPSHDALHFETIHSKFVDFFQCAYIPRLERIYKAIADNLQKTKPTPKLEKAEEAEEADKKTDHKADHDTNSVKNLELLLYTAFNSNLKYSSCKLPLFFSQSSHNPYFGDKGNPATARKSITQVAQELREEDLEPDHIPVSAYVGFATGQFSFFVKNNRTFTAFSKAGIFPTRIVPILPTTEESRRTTILVAYKNNNLGEAIEEEIKKSLSSSSSSSSSQEDAHKEERLTRRVMPQ